MKTLKQNKPLRSVSAFTSFRKRSLDRQLKSKMNTISNFREILDSLDKGKLYLFQIDETEQKTTSMFDLGALRTTLTVWEYDKLIEIKALYRYRNAFIVLAFFYLILIIGILCLI